MDENYQDEKFENDSGDEGAQPYSKETQEKPHRIRISIDIHSIKDQKFRGLIYAKYASLPALGKMKDKFHIGKKYE